MLASHKKTSFCKRGVIIEVARGQVCWSIKGLADRWQWSQSKVRRFLEYLKNEDQIEHQITNVTTLITIINYNNYQEKRTSERRPDEDQTKTRRRHSKNANELSMNIHSTHAREESYPQAPKSPITADFYPSAQTIEYCKFRQLPDPTGQEALDEFINTNLSSNWSSANWDAEYRKFLPKWRLRREQKDKRTRGEKYLDALRDA